MEKTFVISGFSGAIGSQIAREAAKSGYNIVGIFNKSESKAQFIQNEISALGIRCDIFRCNLNDDNDISRLCDILNESYDTVDVLVNCAGIASFGLFDNFSVDEINRVLNINLKSALMLSQVCIKKMLSRKSGCIINISSMWGEVGASCEVIYSAAKAGLIGFTKALAKEISPSGIRVNCITPGLIESDMNSSLSGEDLAAVVEETPVGRIGYPSDVARAVMYLSSDDASFITGEVLRVNGGLVI